MFYSVVFAVLCVTLTRVNAATEILVPDFGGAFGGFTVDGNTYTMPVGAEAWAGTANLNETFYPLTFTDDDDFIKFTASVPGGGSAEVKFRFEYNPHPDVEPSYDTSLVTVSGADTATYQIDIPDRGTETYSSFLLYIVAQDSVDVSVDISDIFVSVTTEDVQGCTDDSASNYDSSATVDDGSCEYAQIDGCTDVYAVNYDSSANTDDGSCNYDPHSLIPDFNETFDGFTVDGNTFTFPTAAQVWAGVANGNTDIYPLMFQGANDFIVFTASLPEGGSTQVKFRFEYNPYPDVDPAYDTNAVTVSGAENATYRINIPDRGTETYSSFLLYIVERDVPVDIFGISIHKNAVLGCTDDSASNYNASATVDDDSCTYDVLGCTDDTAANYDSSATVDDGSCTYDVLGCTDDSASNYDSSATVDDGSCEYAQSESTLGFLSSLAEFTEAFGGTTISTDGNTFEFPSGAETWGGFANMATDIYPFTFHNHSNTPADNITFTASVPSGNDVTIKFRFEFKPHPDVDPAYDTDPVTVSGSDSATYTINITTQGDNTFSSFIMYVATRDEPVQITNIRVNRFAILGCTDDNANNYNASATGNDGSCRYDGCTDSVATNYDAAATDDDGSCTYAQIEGCTDVYAVNYNSSATTDDGSCNYDPHSLIPDFSGPFGGFTVDGNTFTFPTDAEVWAGVANENTDIYPLMFQGANDFIVFTASIPDGGSTEVKFRFEYNPHPDVDPAYDTNAVTVSGAENATYRINIPDRGTETYSSFLLYIVERDVPVDIFGISIHKNAVLGCTDDSASNYNASATVDDDSCTYDVLGCTDDTAANYNSSATVDDGSCTYDVLGCTDDSASNYDSSATVDDDSCTYDDESNASDDSSDDDSTTYIIVGVVVGVVAVVGVIAAVTMLAGSGSGAAVSTASTVQMS